ncbi:MAG: nicotinamidase-related amidase [Ascidiaceihabitans sp.]|jgi:nicotinamidase-related amidase
MTSNTALVLVDIQNDYFDGGLWPLHNMDAAAANAARLLAKARAHNQMVVHVRHEGRETAPFFRPNTVGAQIHSTVAPLPDEVVILKHRPNSFHETDLLEQLQNAQITDLHIAGAMAQMCIDATARAAKDFGFDVTVAADACAAKAVEWNGTKVAAPAVMASFMAALSGTYARVINTDEAG